MLKKFGLVAIGVTAGLAVAAPLASAAEIPVVGEGNSGQFLENNVYGQHNFENAQFNGTPITPGGGSGAAGGDVLN